MSRKKIFRRIIEGCEKQEFDKLVKCYLKVVEGCTKIVNTDGKDDSGLDLRVIDLFGDKIQFQLTIQENQFEKKLDADLIKADQNIQNHGYTNKLFFFYSQRVSNKKMLALKRDAYKKYKINLELIDSNQIADLSEDYLELQKLLSQLAELDQLQLDKELSNDKGLNMLYDLVSFGQPSNLKIQIIEAFLLHKVFNESEISKDKLFSEIKNHFKKEFENSFINNQLNRLVGEKRLKYKDSEKDMIILTDSEKQRIEELKYSFLMEEKNLFKEVYELLTPYNLQNESNIFIQEIIRLLEANYNIDLQEYVSQNSENEISRLSRDFFMFLESKLKKEKDIQFISEKLFELCKRNDFLQKICATKVFITKINPDKLGIYLSKKRPIFIDTQISIYSLCYFYFKNSAFSHYFFEATRDFLNFCSKNGLNLKISQQYVWETKDHIREAINLIPFTKLPFFEKLGKSNNALLNFYMSLVKENYFEGDMSYEEFLTDYGFNQGMSQQDLTHKISYYLNEIGIEECPFDKRYDLNKIKMMFDVALFDLNRDKTSFAMNNDCIMLSYLADNDVQIHPIEPVFVTWDTSFFKVRNKYYSENPSSQRWHMFTPAKFIDHFSTLQFDIGIKVISREIISILHASFIDETHSLIDSISIILNPENEIGYKYSKKLAEIRDEAVFNKSHEPELWEIKESFIVTIDDIIFKLNRHYLSDFNLFENYKEIFKKEEYFDKVIDLFKTEIHYYGKHKRLSENIISKLNEFIEEVKLEKNSSTDIIIQDDRQENPEFLF